MDKIKIGIPRGLFYYYYKDLWNYFFSELGFDIIVSPETNKEIINLGMKYAGSEMCYSMKILIVVLLTTSGRKVATLVS